MGRRLCGWGSCAVCRAGPILGWPRAGARHGGREMAGAVSEGSVLWEPSEEVVANARVTHFIHWLWDRGVLTESYDDLWKWSVNEVDAFWDAIWSYFEVVGERGDGPVRTG